MSFDPDTYLAAKEGGGGFDPDAYLASKEAAPSYDPSDPGRGIREGTRAAIRGVLDMVPFSHRIIAGIQGEPVSEVDKRYEADKEASPLAFRGGQVAGVLGLPGPKGLKGMAAMGAAQAAGDARGGFADTLEQAGLGGVLGTALGGAGKLIGPVAISKIATLLEKAGIKAGRRALSGGGTISVAKPLSDEAVKEALKSGAITFGGTLEGAAGRLRGLRDVVGDQYGTIVRDLEDAGVRGPDIGPLVDKFSAQARDAASNSVASPAPGIFRTAAEDIAAKRASGNPFMPRSHLGLEQAENIKRSLQRQVNYNKFDDTLASEARKSIASTLRQSVEDSIASQRGAAPVLADAFRPVKERLGNIIEASDVANKAAARSSRNRAISLTDTIAGAAGISAGEPITAAAGIVGNKLLRGRGASSVAVAAMGSASLVKKLATMSLTAPERMGKFAAPLAHAAARGDDAVAATHYILAQDPDYQQLMHDSAEQQQ